MDAATEWMTSPEAAARESAVKKRIGRFVIGHATLTHDWRALLPLMGQCVILRAESLYHLEGIEYLALSDAFEEVEVTDSVPFYDVCYREIDGRDCFWFVRKVNS